MTRKSEKRRKGSGIQTLLTRQEKLKYRLILEGIAVGLLAGLVSSAFRWTLMEAESIRTLFVESARQKLTLAVLGIFLLGALAVFIAALLKREPLISGSGIPQVEGELHGKINANWLEVLLAKFLGAVCAIGGGLSLGREGPSIQLGAMVGKGFSLLNNRFRTEEKLLMTCGAGAGLAAAFSAPLAGVVFSLEELHKSFSTEVLLSTMASAITADWIASYIFGLRPVFDLTVTNGLPLSHFWMVILLGIFMGAFGVFYNKALAVSQDFFAKLPIGWLKAGIRTQPCGSCGQRSDDGRRAGGSAAGQIFVFGHEFRNRSAGRNFPAAFGAGLCERRLLYEAHQSAGRLFEHIYIHLCDSRHGRIFRGYCQSADYRHHSHQ